MCLHLVKQMKYRVDFEIQERDSSKITSFIITFLLSQKHLGAVRLRLSCPSAQSKGDISLLQFIQNIRIRSRSVIRLSEGGLMPVTHQEDMREGLDDVQIMFGGLLAVYRVL
jgi:hypothetical protein